MGEKSGGSWRHRRYVVVQKEDVDVSIYMLTQTYPRFREAFKGLKWVLERSLDSLDYARKKREGRCYGLYRHAGDRLAETPDITVMFILDEPLIHLVDVTTSPSENEDTD